MKKFTTSLIITILAIMIVWAVPVKAYAPANDTVGMVNNLGEEADVSSKAAFKEVAEHVRWLRFDACVRAMASKVKEKFKPAKKSKAETVYIMKVDDKDELKEVYKIYRACLENN